uniref:Uncharacterized protein n=1 Tax=Triticum urartu TaxID=4572 RepID=A0A8R7VGK5_TRIUA
MRRLFHSSIHPSSCYLLATHFTQASSGVRLEVRAWRRRREHLSSPSCWRSPSPTPRRHPSWSAWPSAPTAPGRTSRPRKLSKVFRWRSSARTSTATTRARRWAASTAPAPSACPWPPTSTAPTASQLHSAASNTACPGQEPSRIVPVSEGTTFGVVAGAKTNAVASPECASVTLCGPIKKHIIEHFHHKKPVPPKPEPKPQPHPDYGPVPKLEPKPQPHPDYHHVPPTPTYGGGGGGGYHGHH